MDGIFSHGNRYLFIVHRQFGDLAPKFEVATYAEMAPRQPRALINPSESGRVSKNVLLCE